MSERVEREEDSYLQKFEDEKQRMEHALREAREAETNWMNKHREALRRLAEIEENSLKTRSEQSSLQTDVEMLRRRNEELMRHIRDVELESEQRHKQLLLELGEEQKKEIRKRTELEQEYQVLRHRIETVEKGHSEELERVKKQNVSPREEQPLIFVLKSFSALALSLHFLSRRTSWTIFISECGWRFRRRTTS